MGSDLPTLFWVCTTITVYTYILYPLGIDLVVRVAQKRDKSTLTLGRQAASPSVSVILCARDEATTISRRIRNLCSQEYDQDRLEIIVVSDGSTDDTEVELENTRVTLEQLGCKVLISVILKTESAGKAARLNEAIALSRGEVLVFTDSRQLFGVDDEDRNTIQYLVDSLSGPDIGCVSGELRFIDDSSLTLQKDIGAYWLYERWIRLNEGLIDSVPGVTGAIYAMKRSLYEEIPAKTILDDVLIPMRAVLKGYRVILDDRAVARDRASIQPKQEWSRKVRTLAGNWQLLNIIPQAFVPFRNRIWLQFYSHKILRLVVPFALILMLVTSGLINAPVYRLIFMAQLAFYSFAVLAAVFPQVRRIRMLGLTYTFVLLNLASIAGFWIWVTGRCHKVWVR